MAESVDLSMFLDFTSSINFLKKFKSKLDNFNDDNWDIDIYNKNNYEKNLKIMPYFYIDFDKEYDKNIKVEYYMLRSIPWHYDFNIYQNVLNELNIVKLEDLWNSYNYTKKYINGDETITKNYKPNIDEIKKYIPRGYLIPPIDYENIELIINKNLYQGRIVTNPEISSTYDSTNSHSDSTNSPSDNDTPLQYNIDENISKLYNIIKKNDNVLKKTLFIDFLSDNSIFFNKITNNIPINFITSYYFGDNENIKLVDFNDKTKFIIKNDNEKFISSLNNLLLKYQDTIIDTFVNFNNTQVPDDKFESENTEIPNDTTNKSNSKSSWEKKIINIGIWLILYFFIIILIFIITYNMIK
jgi:hypothetical protein